MRFICTNNISITKVTLFSLAVICVSSIMAAPLHPGARVYHLYNIYAQFSKNEDYPQITGSITNLVPSQPLSATNEIEVPNHFPGTITDSGSYMVAPTLSKDGYEQWTRSIKYVDSSGDGCYIQFGWNPVSKMPDVALSSTNSVDSDNCSTGGGDGSTEIVIDNNSN